MDTSKNKTWYRKSIIININIEDVNKSLNNLGQHYKKLIEVYPGMSTVELLEHGNNFVTIKTNEGLMKRTNISVGITADKIIVEFDEEYITNMITTNSHFVEKFESIGDNIKLDIEISNLKAPGFLGFFLRNFGKKNIGTGFIDSYVKLFTKRKI